MYDEFISDFNFVEAFWRQRRDKFTTVNDQIFHFNSFDGLNLHAADCCVNQAQSVQFVFYARNTECSKCPYSTVFEGELAYVTVYKMWWDFIDDDLK